MAQFSSSPHLGSANWEDDPSFLHAISTFKTPSPNQLTSASSRGSDNIQAPGSIPSVERLRGSKEPHSSPILSFGSKSDASPLELPDIAHVAPGHRLPDRQPSPTPGVLSKRASRELVGNPTRYARGPTMGSSSSVTRYAASRPGIATSKTPSQEVENLSAAAVTTSESSNPPPTPQRPLVMPRPKKQVSLSRLQSTVSGRDRTSSLPSQVALPPPFTSGTTGLRQQAVTTPALPNFQPLGVPARINAIASRSIVFPTSSSSSFSSAFPTGGLPQSTSVLPTTSLALPSLSSDSSSSFSSSALAFQKSTQSVPVEHRPKPLKGAI